MYYYNIYIYILSILRFLSTPATLDFLILFEVGWRPQVRTLTHARGPRWPRESETGARETLATWLYGGVAVGRARRALAGSGVKCEKIGIAFSRVYRRNNSSCSRRRSHNRNTPVCTRPLASRRVTCHKDDSSDMPIRCRW